mgnify:CR=1 FL=1
MTHVATCFVCVLCRFPFPSDWDVNPEGSAVHIVELDPGSVEWRIVERDLDNTLSNCLVKAVYRYVMMLAWFASDVCR